MTTHNPTTRNPQLTVDVLDGLRLLWSGASDEARPLLKAAMQEIKRLRAMAGELAYRNTEDERVFTSTNDTIEHEQA